MSGRVDGNGSVNKQIGAHIGTNGDNRFRRDFVRLKILYDRVIYQLRSPMMLYTEGDFEYFLKSMPNAITYSRLLNNDNTFFYKQASELDSYEFDESLVDKYRYITNRIIDTLKQGMGEYQNRTFFQHENEILHEYKDILYDRDRLVKFVENLNKTSAIFSAEATIRTIPSIKPWYSVYFERHGPPGEGVFNSEYLTAIIEELLEDGTITEDDLNPN